MNFLWYCSHVRAANNIPAQFILGSSSHGHTRLIVRALALMVFGTWTAAYGSSSRQSTPLVFSKGCVTETVGFSQQDVIEVHVHRCATADTSTVVLAPDYVPIPVDQGVVMVRDTMIATALGMKLSLNRRTGSISVATEGKSLLTIPNALQDIGAHTLHLELARIEPIYGMSGIDRFDSAPTITHSEETRVAGLSQGNGGAPMFFTPDVGVLLDSVDGKVSIDGRAVTFTAVSRNDLVFFIILGPPLHILSAVADITGHPPMVPRWTLGLLNSQWGLNEKELTDIVAGYRSRDIPLDGFILDFDWKAWGEDDYGEWRWNSTSGPGASQPNLFPGGADGTLARKINAYGVHLAGILKPRILLYKPGSSHELDEAALYANSHKFWYPNEPETFDYVTNRPSRDLDFTNPNERSWFWEHLIPSFNAGIEGWWNDEADETSLPDKSTFYFSSLQNFDMARTVYDGQRAISQKRVWSLNRNFYLGAQRYAYAEWSGDIESSASSMKNQAVRMCATLNLGEPHWSMDAGGFFGQHPSPELYARWVQFASVVPIMRLHGNHDEKRQPWMYGPTAEASATKAIRRRYEIMPYLYAAERQTYETGIGIVRPLFWSFPQDEAVRSITDEWMLGDALLVAPVLDLQYSHRDVYLPAGEWFDRSTGVHYFGARTLTLGIDQTHWSDLPEFIRAGSILATAEANANTDNMHPTTITLDIFPAHDRTATFVFYDDDGATYAYEKGSYHRQQIRAHATATGVQLIFRKTTGNFNSQVQHYIVRVHGTKANRVLTGSTPATTTPWKTEIDQFGAVTEVDVPAWKPIILTLILPR